MFAPVPLQSVSPSSADWLPSLVFAFLVLSQLSPVTLRVFSGQRLFEYYILTMARFSTRQKTPSAKVAAQPSDTGRNVRVRRNPVHLQPPRTPIPPHSDSVVSDVAPSVSSAAALNVAPAQRWASPAAVQPNTWLKHVIF